MRMPHVHLSRHLIPRRHVIPSRLRRHPLLRIALAVVLVIVTLSFVNHSLDARTRWGETRTVFVARSHIDLGEVVGNDAVTTETWPVAVVPDGAVDSSPTGRTTVAAI